MNSFETDVRLSDLPSFLEEFIPADQQYQTILLKGGGNNRVYKIEAEGGTNLVLKCYFQHPEDTRQRLKNEYSFLEYAWSKGIRNIPKPLGKNEINQIALFDYVPGRSLLFAEIDQQIIEKTLRFFSSLNHDRTGASHLPYASEACFSIEDYLLTVEKKLAWIKDWTPITPLEKEVAQFVLNQVIPAWERVKQRAVSAACNATKLLLLTERCITPSDFGFHNALLTDAGEVAFIDFEYAGWDDPAKTVCDFFLQPKVPVPMKYFSQFAESVATFTEHPEKCLERINLVFPICQIKWIFIMLNIFSPSGSARRRFAGAEEIWKKEQQLNHLKTVFNNIRF